MPCSMTQLRLRASFRLLSTTPVLAGCIHRCCCMLRLTQHPGPTQPLHVTSGCSSITPSPLVRSQVLHSLGDGSKPFSLTPLLAQPSALTHQAAQQAAWVNPTHRTWCATLAMPPSISPAPDRTLSPLNARRSCQVTGSPGAAAETALTQGWALRPASLAAAGCRPAAAAHPPALLAAPRCLSLLSPPPSAGSVRTGPQ